jgi:hypothetical protein
MWILRTLGVWSLLAAMIALTIDGTRSLATPGQLQMARLAETWNQVSGESMAAFQAGVETHVHPFLWDPVILAVLQVPTWIFFTGLGLLLYWLGRRRERRSVYIN